MSRLPELTQDTMSAEQRAVAQEIVSGPHGRIVGPHPAWLRSPELARRARALSEFIRFKSSVPKNLLELAILVTGRHWKAEFEYWAHAKLAKQAGVDDAVIAAIAAGRKPTFAKPEEALVYALCSEMYADRRVSDATYAKAVQTLGEQAVVELVATAGYYCMVCLTLNTFQVGLPAGEQSPFPD